MVTVPDGKTLPWPRRKGEGVQIKRGGLITDYLRFSAKLIFWCGFATQTHYLPRHVLQNFWISLQIL